MKHISLILIALAVSMSAYASDGSKACDEIARALDCTTDTDCYEKLNDEAQKHGFICEEDLESEEFIQVFPKQVRGKR